MEKINLLLKRRKMTPEGWNVKTARNNTTGSSGDTEEYPALTQKGAEKLAEYLKNNGHPKAEPISIGEVKFVKDWTPPKLEDALP